MRRIAGGLLRAAVLVGVGFMTTTTFAQEQARPDGQNAANTAAVAPAAATATPEPPQAPQPPPDTPSKRATMTAGFDFASAYLFRGIFQEDRGVIVPPFVDIGTVLYEGTGALKSVSVNWGTWNSLHSGPSGQSGHGNAWYEADYYGGVTFALGRWKPGALFTSYTSPNDAFGSVYELAGVLAYDDSGSRFPLSPKAIVGFELVGQADGGSNRGTYLELGIRPAIKVIDVDRYPVSLAIPVKLGMSLKDYYEGPLGSDRVGYFDTGLIASVPLAFMPSKSAWEVHGGVDFLWLGDNMRLLNRSDRVKPVGILGLSVTY
jgi:hypothetical protein